MNRTIHVLARHHPSVLVRSCFEVTQLTPCTHAYPLQSNPEHKIKPGHVEEYKELIAKYYDSLAKSTEIDVKLTGSWEVVVGELDTFCGAPSNIYIHQKMNIKLISLDHPIFPS